MISGTYCRSSWLSGSPNQQQIGRPEEATSPQSSTRPQQSTQAAQLDTNPAVVQKPAILGATVPN
ncbi:hypothetical protein N7462_002281 [Penicillium macrosclerotiorum]|uniref:uncharacterized protein n=1 Tax=Penicillium macrosclerotiorum TaxID=303699 RepID=UPI002549B2CE|nr:uncharacterized protein N7462_002281 [Penicillium macrosclerotiorum]KAJ5692858.1 hypothetical protein N7462_002281 [Penicillium macrosclerotiorum]